MLIQIKNLSGWFGILCGNFAGSKKKLIPPFELAMKPRLHSVACKYQIHMMTTLHISWSSFHKNLSILVVGNITIIQTDFLRADWPVLSSSSSSGMRSWRHKNLTSSTHHQNKLKTLWATPSWFCTLSIYWSAGIVLIYLSVWKKVDWCHRWFYYSKCQNKKSQNFFLNSELMQVITNYTFIDWISNLTR